MHNHMPQQNVISINNKNENLSTTTSKLYFYYKKLGNDLKLPYDKTFAFKHFKSQLNLMKQMDES